MALKMLILGWDGATAGFIREYLDYLPNLAGIISAGSSGEIISRPASLDVWTTYFTGLQPENHGIYEGKGRYLAKSAPQQPTPCIQDINADRFLWDYLNEAGLKIGMVQGLVTYPAPPVDGFLWSGLPSGFDDACFYPPWIKNLIVQHYAWGYSEPPKLKDIGLDKHWSEVTVQDLEQALQPGYFAHYVNEMMTYCAKYYRAIRRMTRQIPVDVLFVYFLELDHLQHFNYHQPGLTSIIAGYQLMDRLLGLFLKNYQPETVLVLSDHGIESLADKQWDIIDTSNPGMFRKLNDQTVVGLGENGGLWSAEHNHRGFYALRGPGVRQSQNINFNMTDVLPLILGSLKIKIPEDLDGRVPGVLTDYRERTEELPAILDRWRDIYLREKATSDRTLALLPAKADAYPAALKALGDYGWLAGEVSFCRREELAQLPGQYDELLVIDNLPEVNPQDLARLIFAVKKTLKTGGTLIIHGPNPDMMELVGLPCPSAGVWLGYRPWTKILRRAGFRIISSKGIYLPLATLAEPEQPFDPAIDQWANEQAARYYPAYSLQWWIEATKVNETAHQEQLEFLISELISGSKDKPLKINHRTGDLIHDPQATRGVALWGAHGINPDFILFGPYQPLSAGKYLVDFGLKLCSPGVVDQVVVVVDVVTGGGREIMTTRKVVASDLKPGEYVPLTLEFTSNNQPDFEYRVFFNSMADLLVDPFPAVRKIDGE